MNLESGAEWRQTRTERETWVEEWSDAKGFKYSTISSEISCMLYVRMSLDVAARALQWNWRWVASSGLGHSSNRRAAAKG